MLQKSSPVETAGPEIFLSVEKLTKRYDDFVAVDELDLSIKKGELAAFLGPSGCGKTTLLRMIAGLVPPTSGRLIVDGKDLTHVPPHKRDMGLVFQSYALFPHMTIEKNIAFGLEMRNVPKAEIASRVAAAIAMVHLSGKAAYKPQQLSGGQQQRVALARALVTNPSILLLDEPLSNLDAKLREEMRNEIRDIQKRLGITAIFVTHDQEEALTICDRVVVMKEGRVEQIGMPVDLYEMPETSYVASFVGRINRFPGLGRKDHVEVAGQKLLGSRVLYGEVDVMVRPHRIQINSNSTKAHRVNTLPGNVIRATFAGDVVQYEVEAANQVVLVDLPTTCDQALHKPGSPVHLEWNPTDTFVFSRT